MGNESGGGGSAEPTVDGGGDDDAGGDTDDPIKDVWAHNLEVEFRQIRDVIQDYPYISMDTEFPGVVAKPLGEFTSHADFNYQMVNCNVNLLKLIQVGLTFMNEKGETPSGTSTWQFNFKFNLATEMYSQESIQLLQDSGIEFPKLEKDGMSMEDFGELLTTSGLVCSDSVTWLSFHSYDFGYVIRAVTGVDLPKTQEEFSKLRQIIFPNVFDLKLLLKQPAPRDNNVKGGLQEIADKLTVSRIGPQHQAGSDALLTGAVFFKVKEKYFNDDFDTVSAEMKGKLYGLTPHNHHHHHHMTNGVVGAAAASAAAAGSDGSGDDTGDVGGTTKMRRQNRSLLELVARSDSAESSSEGPTNDASQECDDKASL